MASADDASMLPPQGFTLIRGMFPAQAFQWSEHCFMIPFATCPKCRTSKRHRIRLRSMPWRWVGSRYVKQMVGCERCRIAWFIPCYANFRMAPRGIHRTAPLRPSQRAIFSFLTREMMRTLTNKLKVARPFVAD